MCILIINITLFCRGNIPVRYRQIFWSHSAKFERQPTHCVKKVHVLLNVPTLHSDQRWRQTNIFRRLLCLLCILISSFIIIHIKFLFFFFFLFCFFFFLFFILIDDANNGFVYFCEQRTMTFSQPIYLAWNSTSGYFDTCKCNVNYGMFYITVTDLRLKVKLKNKCSSTILQIISTNYICDSQSATFGSVFNRQIDGLTTDAYISITTRFEDVSPDMVVVKLKPKGIL